MYYLIKDDTVYAISNTRYSVNENLGFFWIEGNEGDASVGDKYINSEFKSPLSLDELRSLKIRLLEQKRDEVMNANIIVNNYPFYADDKSINLMHQAITMQGLGIETVFPRSWILANGNVITVSFDDLKAVAVAMAAKKDACYANYLAILPQIMTSDDPESVDIDTGWVTAG